MEKQTRRKFIAGAAALGASAAISDVTAMPMKEKAQLIHHVFFWLKNPGSKDDLKKLIEGVNTLGKIKTLRLFHVGVPAATEKRPVIDDSYHISLLTGFDDVKGHDVYQEDPVHLAFVENYKHLWEKVLIFDSTGV